MFRRNNSWKFEYTGDPEPLAGSGKEDGSDEKIYTGSTGYRKMMGLDITVNDTIKRPAAMNVIRKIPANCTTDEVLAAVKSAMFEMSDWLLQVEAVEASRSDMQDNDLTEDTAHHRSFSDPYVKPLDYTESNDGSQLHGLKAGQGNALLTEGRRQQDRTAFACRGIEEGDENEVTEEEREYRGGEDDEALEECDSDSDEMSLPPPNYEDRELHPPTFLPPFHTLLHSFAHSSAPTHTHTRTRTRIRTRTRAPSDRVSVMFYAFTEATNNKAKWLGKNEKLTRSKFQGGLERVLRLKMTWQQFDSLWTRVDKHRSGDLSFQEFQNVFYNIDDAFSAEGTNNSYVLADVTLCYPCSVS